MSIENYGKYQLLKRLAMGGMAQIYLARRKGAEASEPLLVVKRILPHLAENTDFVRMFLDEARIAARLDHPNIVQIFDLGAQDDSFFIAMEYIHGEDLRRVWKRAERTGQLIPVHLVCRIMSEACAGLDHAHKKVDASGRPLNIVHRDISPQNILLTFEGRAKVVDFGIAKAADQATVTRSGVLKGKYSYMSPEQAAGHKVDRRSDIFALGVVIYELLTGTRLFKRSTDIVTLQAVTECAIQPPSQVNPRVPKDLDPIIMKALGRESSDRYSEAQHFQRALEDWLAAQPQPSSQAHVAAYMKELYAARLAEEARMGEVLVEEAEGLSPPNSKTHDKVDKPISSSMAAPRQDAGASSNRTPPRPSRSDQRSVSSDRERRPQPDARRTVDIRRVADEGPGGSEPTHAAKDQASVSVTTDTDDMQSTLFDEETVARPSRQRPSALSQAHASEPRRRRTALWGVGVGVLVGLLLGAGWALRSESVTPKPGVTVPPVPRPQPPPETSATAPTPPTVAEPTRVQLTLKATPERATLKVDGKPYDSLPVVVSALPGQELLVLAEAPRHKALTRKVTVGQELTQEEVLALEPLPEPTPPRDDHKPDPGRNPQPPRGNNTVAETRKGTVRFAVTPWAEVSCGGRTLGTTPLEDVPLIVGVYECKFSNPELGTRTQRIEVKPNTHTRVVVKF